MNTQQREALKDLSINVDGMSNWLLFVQMSLDEGEFEGPTGAIEMLEGYLLETMQKAVYCESIGLQLTTTVRNDVGKVMAHLAVRLVDVLVQWGQLPDCKEKNDVTVRMRKWVSLMCEWPDEWFKASGDIKPKFDDL